MCYVIQSYASEIMKNHEKSDQDSLQMQNVNFKKCKYAYSFIYLFFDDEKAT